MAKNKKRVVRQEARQAVKAAAKKDGTITGKEAKVIRRDHGSAAVHQIAKGLTTGGLTLDKQAQRRLGVSYARQRNTVTFDPRAFAKKSTSYDPVYGESGVAAGARPMQYNTTHRYSKKAPGPDGWYVSGYRKGKNGEDIPTFAYAGKNLRPGKRDRDRDRDPRQAPSAPASSSLSMGASATVDPLEQQIWGQAQSTLDQIDYFDQMLGDMLYGLDGMANPGTGYGVSVTDPGGAVDTYYTNPVGRRLPTASTLSVSVV